MTLPNVAVIGAMASNRIAGVNRGMPWHLPEDLKRFRELTWGCPIVMGRKTWDSIGRPLPGRENIVLSSRGDFATSQVQIARSFTAALELANASNPRQIFVIGGFEPWKEGLRIAQHMYLTEIHASFDGDVTFPEFDSALWLEVKREPKRSRLGERLVDFEFVDLKRVGN